jgi:hypothetical protein
MDNMPAQNRSIDQLVHVTRKLVARFHWMVPRNDNVIVPPDLKDQAGHESSVD